MGRLRISAVRPSPAVDRGWGLFRILRQVLLAVYCDPQLLVEHRAHEDETLIVGRKELVNLVS